ncbi:NBS-LRR type resistance protein [Cucumis melo var. makuwa]|uniref:NBS-LRR type resistance protein n=1 Tax=Cucumis melo var. makuwa TaxID=1194695 RepID=A0A5A7TKE1_CUCMM|nr:NBS-LRR type resistance protein [Cucumis melo var. makuwa]
MGMNNCHIKAEQAMKNDSDELRTMMSFLSGFDETNAMFLDFGEDINNLTRGSSSMGNNLGESNGKEYIEVIKGDLKRKHKENQTRPYDLHASFLPLVGLPLAVPLPEKLKKRKGGTLRKQSSGSVERIHQSRDPEGCTYQSSDPEGYTYQSSDPEGYTYQSSDPEGCTYQSSDPEGCTYQSSDPEGYIYPFSGRVSLKLGQPRATVFDVQRRGRFAAWRSPTTDSASTQRSATGRRRTRSDEGRTVASGCVRPRGRSKMEAVATAI